MFKRLRPRQPSISPLRQALLQIDPTRNTSDQKETQSKFTLPWWCIFITYGLCLILATVSIVFIIARGIEFGDVKTQQWLISIVSSFFSSILLTQPLKVRSRI